MAHWAPTVGDIPTRSQSQTRATDATLAAPESSAYASEPGGHAAGGDGAGTGSPQGALEHDSEIADQDHEQEKEPPRWKLTAVEELQGGDDGEYEDP